MKYLNLAITCAAFSLLATSVAAVAAVGELEYDPFQKSATIQILFAILVYLCNDMFYQCSHVWLLFFQIIDIAIIKIEILMCNNPP